MKVVLFCGGLGMRLREFSQSVPKPMVPVGNRPMIWQIMKYYSHFGHKDFILCLGYNGHVIKEYFLNYNEWESNDFVLEGASRPKLVKTDIDDWRITFADTGLKANIGMRLKAVEKYLGDDEMFLANYADGLSNLPMDEMIEFFKASGKTACFVCVKPQQSFHYVQLNDDGSVKRIHDTRETGLTVNGGYFVFRREIFDYIKEGEELVHQPFERLIAKNELVAYQYDGFWRCMDTFKDKQAFDNYVAEGDCPWKVWE